MFRSSLAISTNKPSIAFWVTESVMSGFIFDTISYILQGHLLYGANKYRFSFYIGIFGSMVNGSYYINLRPCLAHKKENPALAARFF
jgi:hypothetical protein